MYLLRGLRNIVAVVKLCKSGDVRSAILRPSPQTSKAAIHCLSTSEVVTVEMAIK